MLVETILANLLLDDTSVTAVIDDRIFYRHLPRDPTFPAIVYHHISDPHDSATGIGRQRVQYDCIGETLAGAKELATKVRDALHGDQHKGVYDSVRISFVEYQDMHPGESDTDTGLETYLVDFIVTYTEA